ncbi:MAG: MFS transporter [Simplicispira suum]|uniref:MFS transporter n=1 Tax=Simplicispira suum TaxID=2109915 RepID=UPI001C6BB83F|nr:MFS transporter [Simplicispira suum]MBW7832513.1 MFS transporter [Simplicispira suum]
MSQPTAFSRRQLASYSLLALPLAFAALPLYVLLPNLYARDFGMPLATLGAVLLAARALDAFTDPLLGRLADKLGSGPARWSLAAGAASAVALALGMAALWFPLPRSPAALAAWALVALVLTSAAWSQLGISHQAWGARLGQTELQRGRIMAWRESAGLAGVVLASMLPLLAGLPATLAAFCALLLLGWWAWARAPRPIPAAPTLGESNTSLWQPWQNKAFRRLLLVFVASGIASAIPATLVLFFVQDVLQAPALQEPWFLATYFLCAALSMPLWLRAVARWGLARSWLAGMLLAVAAFAWTALLGAGDSAAFLVVCALSGAALGADLALPSALLAGVAAAQGGGRQHEGAYFGWWNLVAKLNLALAAGLALPLLAALGYAPGARNPAALQTLSFAYAVLPCLLKLAAAAALYALVLRPRSAAPAPLQRKPT